MRRWDQSFESEVPDEGTVNLTPLIDVVFVVLIMFIIVAPLVEMEHISLAPASSIKREQAQSGNISIVVTANEEIRLKGVAVSLDTLRQELTRLRAEHPDEKPKLFHDSKASFGMYQRVKNTAEAAGFEEIDIIVKPD